MNQEVTTTGFLAWLATTTCSVWFWLTENGNAIVATTSGLIGIVIGLYTIKLIRLKIKKLQKEIDEK